MKTRLRSNLERVVTYGLMAAAIVFLIYFLSSVNTSQRQLIAAKNTEIASLVTRIEDSQREFNTRRQQIERSEERRVGKEC